MQPTETTENEMMTEATLVTVVPREDRMRFLPDLFATLHQRVENAIYDWMSELAADYRGGLWEFVRIESGGGYLRPPGKEHRLGCANGFEGTVSADAAGIIVTMYALSHLSFECPSQLLAERYMQVRVLVMEHPECESILDAID
jgi:hypothetical protein